MKNVRKGKTMPKQHEDMYDADVINVEDERV